MSFSKIINIARARRTSATKYLITLKNSQVRVILVWSQSDLKIRVKSPAETQASVCRNCMRNHAIISYYYNCTGDISKIPRADWPENFVIILDIHLQVNITVKARKQDGGYLCESYRGDFKSARSLLSFK